MRRSIDPSRPVTSDASFINPLVDEHPVRLIVEDDLVRRRLTVLFRLILAIPHLIWFVLWSVAVVFVAIAAWFATLVTGQLPGGLHRFLCAYLRYMTHLTAYVSLLANPYPLFTGEAGSYPVDIELPEPERQSRWRTLFRLILAIPALLLAGVLGLSSGAGASAEASSGSSGQSSGGFVTGVLAVIAVLGWFASLATGRMPRGLRDAGVYSVGYRAQTFAYLLLVTPRYPSSDPTAMLEQLERPPLHPVRIVGEASDLRRSRLTVFFRLLLAVPHLVWLGLWSIVVVFAVIVQWFVTLVAGRPASSLHRFLSRYVRYAFHVYAYLVLAANPFPGFVGAPGSYPLDVELPGPAPQNRWKTAFRLILAIPAMILASALGGAVLVAAVLTWFYALARGSASWGLRNLMAYGLRYDAQTYAYLLLVTDRYAYASPLEGEPEGEAVLEPVLDVAA